MARLWLGAAAVAVCVVAASSLASALVVSEGPDFDGGSIGALDAGINTVSGSIDVSCFNADGPSDPFGCPDLVGDDADPFGFSVPGGLELVSFTLDIAQYDGPGRGPAGSFLLAVTDGVTIVDFRAESGIGAEGRAAEESFDPAEGAGGYLFVIGADSFALRMEDGVSFDWTATFTTREADSTEVPLPAGLPLLLAGIAVLGLLRRSRAGGAG